MYGIERFTAIINPPQAAILTVGALSKKLAVDERGRGGGARPDDPHARLRPPDPLRSRGRQFLARVRELLEQPLSLAL